MKTTLFALTTFLLALAVAAPAAVTDFSTIENIPIQAKGREKPFYTFATEALQTLTGRASYQAREGEKKQSAIQTVLEIGFHPHAWADRPLLRIDYKPLKAAVGLSEDRKLFSLAELEANEGLKTQIATLAALPNGTKLNHEQREINAVITRVGLLHSIMEGSAFTFVPSPAGGDGSWVPVALAAQAFPGVAGDAAAKDWAAMGEAFLKGDQAAFDRAAGTFSGVLASMRPEAYPKASLMKLETLYGKVHPFGWAWKLYALAAVILWVTTLWARNTGYRIAWAVVLSGFLLQIGGFAARVTIGGRGPVTNMYESVLWAAFGIILFALILEAIYRSRYMFLGGTPIAALCLILADTQTSILKPSIDPLETVLRNNFWLSTHVTSITLSYAAFALALGVGHIILGKVFLRRPVSAALYNYLYRSLQIGVLLLAIGTILGGFWANVSWGRFWDWDPKETWALIALLGYLALLHGRIAGWWKNFGMAVGSILAFQSVLMAWYGVNFILGAGLHSYGFSTGGFPAVITYVSLELVFVTLVVLRRKKEERGSHQPEPESEEEADADYAS